MFNLKKTIQKYLKFINIFLALTASFRNDNGQTQRDYPILIYSNYFNTSGICFLTK